MARRTRIRGDGYRPVFRELARSGARRIVDEPHQYILVAAERLDLAHRQLLRLRSGVRRWTQLAPGAAKAQATLETVGDARLAMIALNRALAMALELKTRYKIRSPVPRMLKKRADAIREIRDAYEHIDKRVRGEKRGRPVSDARDVLDMSSIMVDRRMKYSRWSVDIDEDATVLCFAIRDFLTSAWDELETGRMRLL